MAGFGPPPKKASEKRRPNAGTFNKLDRVLPASGRRGDTPAWPLPDPIQAELEVWDQIWRTPQAVAWETLGWERAVARYVRDLLPAEQRGAPTNVKTEVRQHEDRLGLNPMSLLRLRWEIRDVDDAAVKPQKKATVTRLKAVESA
jgi:hypothetical protein